MSKAKDIFDLISELRDEPLSKAQNLILDIRADIAGKLLAYREGHNLTQEELAEKLGISHELLDGIEAGMVSLSIEELADIAVKLGGSLKIELEI